MVFPSMEGKAGSFVGTFPVINAARPVNDKNKNNDVSRATLELFARGVLYNRCAYLVIYNYLII